MNTPNYNFKVFSSDDTTTKFLAFRTDIAGTQEASNFMVVDSTLKQHEDAIELLQNKKTIQSVDAIYVSDNYYSSVGVSGFSEYKDGEVIILSLNTTNEGTVTLKINELATKSVMKYNKLGVLVNLNDGDFVKNHKYLLMFTDDKWVLIGSSSLCPIDGTSGNLTSIDSNNNIEDSGISVNDETATSSNLWTAQKTKNYADDNFPQATIEDDKYTFDREVSVTGGISTTGDISVGGGLSTGSITSSGNITVNGIIQNIGNALPLGSGDLDYWKSVPQGTYFYNTNLDGAVPSSVMPSEYGIIIVNRYSTEGTAIFYTQPTGEVYRQSWNTSALYPWYKVESVKLLWTGKLLCGSSISLNTSGFSKIRVYAISYDIDNIFEIDLSHSTSTASNNFRGCGVTGVLASDNREEYHYAEVTIPTAKTTLSFDHTGYEKANGNFSRNNNSDYYIYRVEGIY